MWVGYDPARPMQRVHGRTVTGGSFPAAIFGRLMRRGLEGVPVKRIPVAGPDRLGLSILNPEPPPPVPPTTFPAPSLLPLPDSMGAPPDLTPITLPSADPPITIEPALVEPPRAHLSSTTSTRPRQSTTSATSATSTTSTTVPPPPTTTP